MSGSTRDAEALVAAFVEAWNQRAYARFPELVSESYVLADPAAPGGEARGAEGTEAYLRGIVEGFPDFRIEILESLAREDVVMVELEWTGTHRGTFDGLPPTGRSVALRGAEKHRVADGALQRTDVYLDSGALKAQLGLEFPEILGQLPALAWRKLRGGR